MATLQKAGVVLTSPRDWDEWIETIKTASIKAGVWGYIDLSIEDPPTLLQPVRPIPEFVRSATQAGGGVTAQTRPGVSTRASGSQTIQPSVEGQQQLTPITYASLTEDQKEQLRNLQADFQYEGKVWENQEEAIQGLRSKIQETIKRDFLPYTYNCDTPYDMLRKLRDRFAPTQRARIREWRLEWQKAAKMQRGKDLEDWLLNWENLYTQG
ncbi:hypothetical protein GMDG_08717, partial [Pseudogymnoascus destructans 20631-21]